MTKKFQTSKITFSLWQKKETERMRQLFLMKSHNFFVNFKLETFQIIFCKFLSFYLSFRCPVKTTILHSKKLMTFEEKNLSPKTNLKTI